MTKSHKPGCVCVLNINNRVSASEGFLRVKQLFFMALFCALFVESAGFNSLIFDKLHQLWLNEMFPNRFKSFCQTDYWSN